MAQFTYEQVKDKKVVHFQIRRSSNYEIGLEQIAVLDDEQQVLERFQKISDELHEKFGNEFFLEADELTDDAKRFVFS